MDDGDDDEVSDIPTFLGKLVLLVGCNLRKMTLIDIDFIKV